MKLPLFPLPIFLLPGGITRLRIFEQRYLKMVRDINKTNGFAIYYNAADKHQPAPNWASWVDIIDFTLPNDGVLVIDVQCHALVNITSTRLNDEQLLIADISPKPHWPERQKTMLEQVSTDVVIKQLSAELQTYFTRNSAYYQQYQPSFFQDPFWVCRRWLELLPVTFNDKQHFLAPDTFDQALQFICDILSIEIKDK
jgi:Lon protease-like protein